MKLFCICMCVFLFLDTLRAQEAGVYCDTIYEEVDSLPFFKTGRPELIKYVMRELSFTISDCLDRSDILSFNIHLNLVIDQHGDIRAVEFTRFYFDEECADALKEKLLSISGWVPAMKDGKYVCSRFRMPMNICAK